MKRLLLAACTAGLCACSTVASKTAGGLGDPYSGTRLAYDHLEHGGPQHPLVLAVIAVDVPLSAVADTFVLPVDLLCCRTESAYPADPAGEPVLPP